MKLSDDPNPTLHPDTFILTLRAAERYLQIDEAGGWPLVEPGKALKVGDRGPVVATLRQRLALTDDLAPEAAAGDVFDATLAAAVRRFQVRHGLPDTGVVGPKTVKALNVPARTRFRQLTQSAQRLAGTNFGFGARYVVVNIPAATVEAVEGGRVVRRYVAVVGREERASPTIMARISAVNLNPTWTVPVSIIKKDIIPQMRKDPAYLTKARIRILDGAGREIDPTTINWTTNQAANFTLRQDPGAENSLGQVRIDMPNRHAVYMHDTNSKRLFARDDRFHSSGCVRVADVTAFAEWLLADTPDAAGPWTKEAVEAAIATGARRDVKLSAQIPVAWVYMTGYASPDGTVHFREDVYGWDDPDRPRKEEPAPPPVPVAGAPAKRAY